jgi:hypothetical protein
MIHALKSKSRTGMLSIAATSLTLAGCAGSGDKYPSFAFPAPSKDAGRVSIEFPNIVVRDPIDAGASAEALPQELDARLAALSTRALNASQSFGQSAPATAQLVDAASLAPLESDTWTDAQISLASLNSHYSKGRLALAELDILASNARVTLAATDTIAEIAQVQDEVSARLEEQKRILDELNAKLDQQ